MEMRFDNYPENHPRKTKSIEQELTIFERCHLTRLKPVKQSLPDLSCALGDGWRFLGARRKGIMVKNPQNTFGKDPLQRIAEAAVPIGVDVSPIVISRPDIPNASIAGDR